MAKGFYKALYVDLDGKKHSKKFECQIKEDGFFDNKDAFNKASKWIESKEYTESKISFHTIMED